MSDITAREQQVAREYGGQWIEPGVMFFPHSVHLGEVVQPDGTSYWVSDRIEEAIHNPDPLSGYDLGVTDSGQYLHDMTRCGDGWYPK